MSLHIELSDFFGQLTFFVYSFISPKAANIGISGKSSINKKGQDIKIPFATFQFAICKSIINYYLCNMKAHNGMRPHDVVVLLKIISLEDNWMNKDLSASLFISASEISESLNRSMIARLISPDKKKVFKGALFKFIENGLSFVFPAAPGALVRGTPTSHSAPVLKGYILADDIYVWPNPNGDAKGQAIVPLYPNQVQAALCDEKLYNMLALVDSIRVGKVREVEKALELLKQYFEMAYA